MTEKMKEKVGFFSSIPFLEIFELYCLPTLTIAVHGDLLVAIKDRDFYFVCLQTDRKFKQRSIYLRDRYAF